MSFAKIAYLSNTKNHGLNSKKHISCNISLHKSTQTPRTKQELNQQKKKLPNNVNTKLHT